MNNTPISSCKPNEPAVHSVENIEDVKKFRNSFVYVVNNNSVYYIDCKHRITIISSGIVSVSNYNTATNPNNLRNQFAYDNRTGQLTYFNAKGIATPINAATLNLQFDDLSGRPMYGGQPMTSATNIEPLPDLDAMTGITLSATDSSAQLDVSTTNVNGSGSGSTSIPLPIVSATSVGLATPAILSDIVQNSTELETVTNTLTDTNQTVTSLSQDVAANKQAIETLSETVTGDAVTIDQKLATKQDTLVSGTNIKTINGESVLGTGDIQIIGGGAGPNVVQETGTSTVDVMSQKAVTDALSTVSREDSRLTDTGATRANHLTQTILADVATTATASAVNFNTYFTNLDTGGSDTAGSAMPIVSATQAGILTGAQFKTFSDKLDNLPIIQNEKTSSSVAHSTGDSVTITLPSSNSNMLYLIIGELIANNNGSGTGNNYIEFTLGGPTNSNCANSAHIVTVLNSDYTPSSPYTGSLTSTYNYIANSGTQLIKISFMNLTNITLSTVYLRLTAIGVKL